MPARSGGRCPHRLKDYLRLLERNSGGVLVAEDEGRVGGDRPPVCAAEHWRRSISHALVDAVYEDAGAGGLCASRGSATNPGIARYWLDL